MSKRDMANLADCGRTTISRYLKKYNIVPRRDDPDLIKSLYHAKGLSTREIAERFNCGKSSILRTMDENGISRDKSNRDKNPQYCSHTDGRGYMVFRHNGNFVYEHRLLAIAEFGFDEVKDKHVHHKDEIKWNNQRSNLSLMSAEEHARHHHSN